MVSDSVLEHPDRGAATGEEDDTQTEEEDEEEEEDEDGYVVYKAQKVNQINFFFSYSESCSGSLVRYGISRNDVFNAK